MIWTGNDEAELVTCYMVVSTDSSAQKIGVFKLK